MRVYLKIVLGDWANASRDKRELSVAKQLGFDVIVIASTKNSRQVYKDKVEGFDVVRIPTRKYGEGRIKKYFGYLTGFLMFIREAEKIEADIISGHNYSGLLVGYLATKHKEKKTKLIYDSHEYELYQKKRNWLAFRLVKMVERFLVKRASINMMVTDSIAEGVQEIYGLNDKPLVIRNVPEKSELHYEQVKKNWEEYQKQLDIDGDGFIIMFHGALAQGRGIEQAIQATAQIENVGLVIMGYALEDNYKKELIQMVDDCKVKNRVYFRDAVPFTKLYDYVAAADAGIVLTQNDCLNFVYSLPNKLFENIQAMTPVIGSDFPEIGHLINRYNIGITIQPDDIDALVDAIKQMKNDKILYKTFKDNMAIAREELCWEKEREKLVEAIRKIER